MCRFVLSEAQLVVIKIISKSVEIDEEELIELLIRELSNNNT